MLIYKFECQCSSTYIGRTCQGLEVRIKQHVPRVIIKKCRQTSRHSQAIDSAIGEHLLTINNCRTNFEDDCFSVLHRARDKIHLNVLEAIYIAINRPHSMQTVKQSHFKFIWGSFFLHFVPSIQLITLHLVFNYYFWWQSLTNAGRKFPRCFIFLK